MITDVTNVFMKFFSTRAEQIINKHINDKSDFLEYVVECVGLVFTALVSGYIILKLNILVIFKFFLAMIVSGIGIGLALMLLIVGIIIESAIFASVDTFKFFKN